MFITIWSLVSSNDYDDLPEHEVKDDYDDDEEDDDGDDDEEE